jgi:site-specific DNA recombinase
VRAVLQQSRRALFRLRGSPAQAAVKAYRKGESAASIRALVSDLNRRGVPSPCGKAWHPAPTRNLLRCPHYTGNYVWNRDTHGKYHSIKQGHPVKAARRRSVKRLHNAEGNWSSAGTTHEALVDHETWEIVQRKLNERRKHTAPCSGGGRLLLSGLIRCGRCGHAMHGETPRNPRALEYGERQYLCSGYQMRGRAVCNHHVIPEDPLHRFIVRMIERDFFHTGNFDKLREEITRQLRVVTRSTGG